MASTYLTRTTGTPTDHKKYTFSAWIKRCDIGAANSKIFSRTWGSGGEEKLEWNQDNLIWRNTSGGGGSTNWERVTNRKFRDCSAFYHVCITFDSTQSTAGDRLKMWINGVQETSFSGSSDPSLNAQSAFMDSGITQNYGRYGGGSQYTSAIWSHVHLTDGYAYAASDFGETDATTGEWKIKTSPSGITYGNNGFWWFKDNANTTDNSPNSNTFTVAGGTLTKTEDCPSNVFCTINPLSNKIAFSLANGNTTLNDNGSDDNDNGIAATMGVNSGKYYWEMKKGSGSGGVHAVITDDVDVRLGNRATSSPDSNLWGFQSNGTGAPLVSYIAGTFDSSGNALQGWGANDIIGFALDMDNGKLYVSINGVFKGLDNNTSDPANATNPAITGIPTGGKFIIPYFEKRSADSPETMCNFGNGYFGTTAVSSNSGNGYSASGSLGVFQYQPPSGYTALCTKGLNE